MGLGSALAEVRRSISAASPADGYAFFSGSGFGSVFFSGSGFGSGSFVFSSIISFTSFSAKI